MKQTVASSSKEEKYLNSRKLTHFCVHDLYCIPNPFVLVSIVSQVLFHFQSSSLYDFSRFSYSLLLFMLFLQSIHSFFYSIFYPNHLSAVLFKYMYNSFLIFQLLKCPLFDYTSYFFYIYPYFFILMYYNVLNR